MFHVKHSLVLILAGSVVDSLSLPPSIIRAMFHVKHSSELVDLWSWHEKHLLEKQVLGLTVMC